LVPVNHAIGHIEIAFLTTGSQDPLVILVSGGHTLITAYAGLRWRIFGETEDITIGNLLDMFAREIGLSPPSGLSVEQKASYGKKLIELPYSVKGNDVTYSGLLSASLRKFREGYRIEDLCYSLQEVSFSMFAETVERSLAHTEKKELLLTGGVAANKRLQEMLRIIARDHNSKFHVVDPKYSGDCGAQIAWAGYLAFKQGIRIDIDKSYVVPKWRLDEIEWKR
ncbi:Kae1-like domain-containing protein, partial [[Eubacterium] cellulosolvens]